VDAINTGRGTTILTYDITTGEYVITPQERMDMLVERIKKRLIKIDRLNDIKGQKELGIHVTA